MESIVKLFSDSLKLKRSSSDLILSHLLKWSRRTFLTESIVNLFSDSLKMKKWPSDLYPFFEPTRLSSKKVPQWSLLLCFFRLSKYEKPPSLPSLGLLNLQWRTLPLCVLSTAFAYLIHQPCDSLLLRLNTFGRQRIFLSIILLNISLLVPWACMFAILVPPL